MSNRSGRSVLGLTWFFAVTSLLAVGCGEDDFSDAAYGSIDLAPYFFDGSTPNNPTNGLPREIRPARGWINGLRAEYYDFGVVAAGSVRPMYFFFDSEMRPIFSKPILEKRSNQWYMRGGINVPSPNPADDKPKLGVAYSQRIRNVLIDPDRNNSTEFQRPIVDFLNNSGDYTGLWEIVEVIVPDGYQPDSIKRYATLENAVNSGKFKWRRTGRVINCPMLDDRTYVTPSSMAYGIPHPRIEVWYRTKLGSCYLANGWEALGDNDINLYKAKRTDIPFAPEDEERLDTFDVIRSVNGKGVDARPTIYAPTGRMFTPAVRLVNQNPERPPFDIRYIGDDITEWRPRHTPADPPGYRPLRSMQDIRVAQDPPFRAGTYKALIDVDPALIASRSGVGGVKSFSFIGAAIPCRPGDNTPCAPYGMECNEFTDNNTLVTEPPLGKTQQDVNWEQEGGPRCDVKQVGFGEWCAPGIARCRTQLALEDEKLFREGLGGTVASSDRPTGGYGFACFPAQGGYCYTRCNGDEPNQLVGDDASLKRILPVYPLDLHLDQKHDQGWDTSFDIDSRCGSNRMVGYACVGQTIPSTSTGGIGTGTLAKMRFCIRTCSRSAYPDHVNAYRCNLFRVVKPEHPLLCPDPNGPDANGVTKESVDFCPRCPLPEEKGSMEKKCDDVATLETLGMPAGTPLSCLPRTINGVRQGRCFGEPAELCEDPANVGVIAKYKVDFCADCLKKGVSCKAGQHCQPQTFDKVRQGRCYWNLDEANGSLQEGLPEPGLTLNDKIRDLNIQPGMICTNYNSLSACMWDPAFEPRDSSIWPPASYKQ